MASYMPEAYQQPPPPGTSPRGNSGAPLGYGPSTSIASQRDGQMAPGLPTYGTPSDQSGFPHQQQQQSYVPAVAAMPMQTQPHYPNPPYPTEDPFAAPIRPSDNSRRMSHSSHHSRHSPNPHENHHSDHSHHSHHHHHSHHSDDLSDSEEGHSHGKKADSKSKHNEAELKRPTVGDTMYSMISGLKSALGPRDKY